MSTEMLDLGLQIAFRLFPEKLKHKLNFSHMENQKYDVILVPYERYQNLTLEEFRSLLHEDGVTGWLDGDLQLTEVDGEMYFAANLKWDKVHLNELVNKIYGKDHFWKFYITRQGRWNGREYI